MSTDDGDLPRRASIDGGINLDHPDSWTVISPGSADPLTVSTPNDPIRQVPSKSCAFWNNFLSFVPEPAAPFVDEFNRLAKHRRWRKKEKREYLAKALTAEIDFHSDKSSGLVRWKRLCQEVRVGSEPESITKCKKVLGSLFVNLYSLVDHRRNPDVPVVCFKSFKELVQDIGRTGTFPRQCAKRDRYMKVLLKKM